MGSRMREVGRDMTIAGVAIAAPGIAAIKMATDFEASMTRIETLVGLARDTVDEMGQSVLDLSGETARSPVELAEALFVVTSAGARGAVAMETLTNAARAAAIGLGNTSDIARTVTAAVTAYGAENLSAAEATNILVGTVRAGNLVAADLAGTVHDVREEIRKLPQLHDQLWDIFKPVRNKKDMEQFEQLLGDEALRQDFYARLRAFSRCLHISLSSDKLLDVFDEAKIDTLKRDWKQFSELRRSVQLRYQETVDVREFEPKIQKLLDDHVVALPAETIIEVVNINDPDALKAVVEETGVSEASRADRIASATRRAITEKMEEDPTFYREFSELLEDTIRAYRERRLSERDYLNSVVDLASKVARKDRGREVPEPIRGDDDAQAFFGVLDTRLTTSGGVQVSGDDAAHIALDIVGIIRAHLIVDIWSNDVAQNNLRNAIDDFFFDVLRDQKGIELPVEVLDDIELKIMDLARARFAG
ncbi:hypothetical protein LCGC14_1382230 [marine sediment metagenome]|uniref:Type I restriction enzyme HindI endonuclease subunit-like C-terminal domain-containing protein n=1 Tax=marine sediment metagenome TaxID=412755 RepID=A0A0F9KN57_9ZZZZ